MLDLPETLALRRAERTDDTSRKGASGAIIGFVIREEELCREAVCGGFIEKVGKTHKRGDYNAPAEQLSEPLAERRFF